MRWDENKLQSHWTWIKPVNIQISLFLVYTSLVFSFIKSSYFTPSYIYVLHQLFIKALWCFHSVKYSNPRPAPFNQNGKHLHLIHIFYFDRFGILVFLYLYLVSLETLYKLKEISFKFSWRSNSLVTQQETEIIIFTAR